MAVCTDHMNPIMTKFFAEAKLLPEKLCKIRVFIQRILQNYGMPPMHQVLQEGLGAHW